MTIGSVLFPAAVLALVVLLVVMFFQRREALDLSPRSLMRSYLYLGSLAGILTLAMGLAALTNYGLAAAFGSELIYGDIHPAKLATPRCPPGTADKGCVEPTPEQLEQERQRALEQLEVRRSQDLLQGLTFTSFGAVIWAAHWGARRGLIAGSERGSGLRRAYLMVGTVIFGLATVMLVPHGVYQALSRALIQASPDFYLEPANSLGGGLAALAIWLVYLRQLIADFRETPAQA